MDKWCLVLTELAQIRYIKLARLLNITYVMYFR